MLKILVGVVFAVAFAAVIVDQAQKAYGAPCNFVVKHANVSGR